MLRVVREVVRLLGSQCASDRPGSWFRAPYAIATTRTSLVTQRIVVVLLQHYTRQPYYLIKQLFPLSIFSIFAK